MIFEKEFISATPLEVLELRQSNLNQFNSGRSFDALSFRIRSDARMITEEGSYPMSPNTVCYVPAGLSYRRIAGYDELIAINFQSSGYIGSRIEYFVTDQPEALLSLFRETLRVWQEKKPGYRYHCTALFNEILFLCHQQNAAPQVHTSKIQASVEYMQRNCTKPTLSIGEIAQKSYISEVYFRKLFQKEFGISPQKYLIKLRLQNASKLMTSGYYSLKEVAYLSGYRDYKYFCVEFKRFYGISPSEYCDQQI